MTTSSFSFEDRDEFVRGQLRYWREVREAGYFDLEGISVPQGTTGLMIYDCERKDILLPYPVLVKRYAAFGLYRYNVLHGTKFQLHHLKKFNVTMTCQATYYITLVALDPATTWLVTIQVGVAEGRRRDNCSLNLSCSFSMPQGGTQSQHDQLESFGTVDPQLPHWPLDFNDSQRFYAIEESDLQENDYIRLFLELALCTNDRELEESDLSQLQIVRVVTEIIHANDAVQAMAPKAALPWVAPCSYTNFYITFKGLALARFGELGEHVERRIIVSRAADRHNGCMTLLGGYGFTTGEVAEEREVSRPSFISLYNSGKFIPYRGPMTGPPLAGILARKAIELGLFNEAGEDLSNFRKD